jgi:hypothetical protein
MPKKTQSSPPSPKQPKDNWLPSDPLYKLEEWAKIKATLQPLTSDIDFQNISWRLITIVGTYRAEAMVERPEKSIGTPHQQRIKARRELKALNHVKRFFLFENRAVGKMEKIWFKEVHSILSHRLMRLHLHDTEANHYIEKFLIWLNDPRSFLMDGSYALKVIDPVLNLYMKGLAGLSRRGRSKRALRNRLIRHLINLWMLAKNHRPTIYTDRETGLIGGDFTKFVFAVITPISEQLGDTIDTEGLSVAVKKAVYPTKSTKGKK